MFELPVIDAGQIAHSLPTSPRRTIVTDSRKALVLDLDETLIHTSTFPPHSDVESLKFDDSPDYVFLRPNVRIFLDKVSELFEVFIFTAGTQNYAERILDLLCPQIDHFHRFYRDSCKIRGNKCKKDLSKFGRPLSHVIMVDDNYHMRDLYPQNTIYIDKWTGTPYDTTLLDKLLPLLETCAISDDVRPIVKDHGEECRQTRKLFY
ncbi:NLI interacting factor-like phosphatase family protein [Trichomonas vaginalis G3]|uniref:Mitochondrial import inner membrane translocase subunit TIM50 n=1 Tax=Trichomonas vaginalis (strain ATCC PRA-98 / G3) TaxID=412133 RepID=A2G091_TRIV3|nr:phosphoprotein phosphatase protein [Trichomonas vaginalis G3]EAX89426.1 NLI interacting factor-like phosphatase family protein [Trichomonas vaginalis G3]KAI5511338.1 phosphoprotein phosphatase protein [Trichomonas vaginalis G3]|eukprot:XP_001302356.1 NLI interacting factor-like phosphatase family protein [Trichomonas vaginalis G3]